MIVQEIHGAVARRMFRGDRPKIYPVLSPHRADSLAGASELSENRKGTRIMNSSAPDRNESDRNESDRNESGRNEVGRIEVIVGPMFSGKSEELIRRLKRARIARQRVACFKPDIDLRYHRTAIASHSAQTHEAMTVANVARLREAIYGQLPEVEVIGIDEAQFFDAAIVHLVGELVHMGKRILIAGLDTTFTGEPFGPIPALMAISDEVTKLSAVCIVCGAPAIHTQRLGASRELVVVGAAGVYEARCRACFRPYLNAPENEQMELPDAAPQLKPASA